MPGRRPALIVAAVLAAVVVVAGTMVVLSGRGPDDGSSTGRSVTAWDAVMGGVGNDGTVSFALAKQAFSLAYKPLPGVTVPAGAFGPPQDTSAAGELDSGLLERADAW